MMTVEIRDLTFECIIGILEHERTRPQRVVVDARIDYLYDAGNFVDYGDVVSHIKTSMQHNKFELIETALNAVSTSLKTDFSSIKSLNLTISKPDILPDCRVCVTKKSNF